MPPLFLEHFIKSSTHARNTTISAENQTNNNNGDCNHSDDTKKAGYMQGSDVASTSSNVFGSGDEEEEVEEGNLQEKEIDVESSAGDSHLQVLDLKQSKKKQQLLQIGVKETMQVFRLRVLVFAALFFAAAAVSFTVYYVTRNGEIGEFESTYEAKSVKVLTSFKSIVEQKISALSSLGVSLTSYPTSNVDLADMAANKEVFQEYITNASWPFITMNDFQQRAAAARYLSNALYIEVLPIISEANRLKWETYSVQNADWLTEGRAFQTEFNLGFGADKSNDQETTNSNENSGRKFIRTRNLQKSTTHNNNNQGSIEEVMNFSLQDMLDSNNSSSSTTTTTAQETQQQQQQQTSVTYINGIADRIYTLDQHNANGINTATAVVDPGPGPYYPVWQSSPVLDNARVNYNQIHQKDYADGIYKAHKTGEIVIGGIDIAEAGNTSSSDEKTRFFSTIKSFEAGKVVDYKGDPMSSVYVPVFSSYDYVKHPEIEPVAVIIGVINWASYFKDILANKLVSIIAVLDNGCDGPYTFEICGPNVFYWGKGDLHQTEFDKYEKSTNLTSIFRNKGASSVLGLELYKEECTYQLRVYPSYKMKNHFMGPNAIYLTVATGMVFAVCCAIFIFYTHIVERRQALVLKTAERSTALVNSLFPEVVHQRLMDDTILENGKFVSIGKLDSVTPVKKSKNIIASAQVKLESYLEGNKDKDATNNNESEQDEIIELDTKPIADLFPECTVFFCDISGFTAWSSARDPAQVFILLQTIYQSFDQIAKKLRVFKVETIGDTYVAVAGLPNPQEKHAVIMSRFAWECMNRFNELVKRLEVNLGPDTGDLAMRFGLHSGPVTAGVLRGDRSRFQLFGDTVNTAARMESTGFRNRIQVSNTTADLLRAANKGHWLTPRKDAVEAKGKGLLKTFWLNLDGGKGSSANSADGSHSGFPRSASQGDFKNCEDIVHRASDLISEDTLNKDLLANLSSYGVLSAAKQERLINWMTELLLNYLKAIVAKRTVVQTQLREQSEQDMSWVFSKLQTGHGKTRLDEVAEIIKLPESDGNNNEYRVAYSSDKINGSNEKADKCIVDEAVHEQLRRCVSIIAATYQNNPFHNFEHACHVTMSTDKFLRRIEESLEKEHKAVNATSSNASLPPSLYNNSDIYTDPLTRFAIVFSALIHDVDHRGISNVQLIKEDHRLADLYRHKSVAEQNSLDIAWDVLMCTNEFANLQSCLFATKSDLQHFRQVIVNVVLATDIFDKEINDLRKSRWVKAFNPDDKSASTFNDIDVGGLQATVVIEHIIQASDVVHTMQHWQVYRKWNERLFQEMYMAYLQGRTNNVDPSVFWHQNELGFFDFYVIPLARKLQDCRVFGASSDECLNYAQQNRAEWAHKGRSIVEDYLEKYGKKSIDEKN